MIKTLIVILRTSSFLSVKKTPIHIILYLKVLHNITYLFFLTVYKMLGLSLKSYLLLKGRTRTATLTDAIIQK